MSSPAEKVDSAWSAALDYAGQAQGLASSWLHKLESSLYSAPTVNFTWSDLAPPAFESLPEFPSLPNITPSLPPDKPEPITEQAPSVTIDDFTEAAPHIEIGQPPEINLGSVPSIPDIGEVLTPPAPEISTPSPPALLSISTPSFSGVDLHDDWLDSLSSLPQLNLVEPTPFTHSLRGLYSSSLLETLRNKLANRLEGGTGLPPAVEQALWNRARDREVAIAQAAIDDALMLGESLGFSLPPGAVNAKLFAAQKNYYDKLSSLSRDISIKQAELEQENLKQSIAAVQQLEDSFMNHFDRVERLSFEASKQYADNAIQLYNASVENYKALLEGYKAYAAAYKAIIDGQLAKVEVYKAQLDAEKSKAEINTALVEQYKASITALMGRVDIYRAQMGAAQTLIELERAKIAAAGERIQGYVAQVNAETAKLEAYKAALQGKQAEIEIYKAKAQAFSSKVSAQAERARAETSRYEALIRAKTAEWEGYKAQIQAETTRLDALAKQSSIMLDSYKAVALATESKAKMEAQIWETKIKEYEAAQQLALNVAKMNTDAVNTTNQARLDAAKAGAQVYAQLAASALNIIHANAGVSGNANDNYNYNYNYEM